MNKGPIFIIDEDIDDHDLVKELVKELKYSNEVVSFFYGEQLLKHIDTVECDPFIIICDVNLPGLDGFEVRKKLEANKAFKYKSVPFIYWSNVASSKQIKQAYDAGGHGFFIKAAHLGDIRSMLKDIFEYWYRCVVPADV